MKIENATQEEATIHWHERVCKYLIGLQVANKGDGSELEDEIKIARMFRDYLESTLISYRKENYGNQNKNSTPTTSEIQKPENQRADQAARGPERRARWRVGIPAPETLTDSQGG